MNYVFRAVWFREEALLCIALRSKMAFIMRSIAGMWVIIMADRSRRMSCVYVGQQMMFGKMEDEG